MKLKYVISVVLLSGDMVGTTLYSVDSLEKIRSRFNIQGMYSNGVLRFSSRDNAWITR